MAMLINYWHSHKCFLWRKFFLFKGEEHMIILGCITIVGLSIFFGVMAALCYSQIIRLITALRIVSIVFSILFVVMAVLCYNSILNEKMQLVTLVLGIITAVLNIISTIAWWLTDNANAYNANQLRYFGMLGGR